MVVGGRALHGHEHMVQDRPVYPHLEHHIHSHTARHTAPPFQNGTRAVHLDVLYTQHTNMGPLKGAKHASSPESKTNPHPTLFLWF